MADYFMGLGEPTGLGSLARSMGMRYLEGELDRQYWADNPNGVPELPLLKHGGTSRITDMCYGTFGGLRAQLFTFSSVTYPDDPGHDIRSCVLFSVPANFSTLTIGPHTKLSLAQERSRNPFSTRFRVFTRDPEVSELVLDDGMRQWLLGVDPNLRFELSGTALLGHTRLADDETVPVVLQQVYGTYLRIPDLAWERYGLGF